MAHLIIGSWSSQCSECGGNAHPEEGTHIHGGPDTMMDMGSALSDRNGCGAEFNEPATGILYGKHLTAAQ